MTAHRLNPLTFKRLNPGRVMVKENHIRVRCMCSHFHSFWMKADEYLGKRVQDTRCLWRRPLLLDAPFYRDWRVIASI